MPDDPQPDEAAAYALSEEEIEHFVEHGYLVLPECFSREEALELVASTFHDNDPAPWLDYRLQGQDRTTTALGDVDLEDPSTWPKPTLNLHTGRELDVATFAPKLWGALHSLVGDNKVMRDKMGQLWKINAEFTEGPAPPLMSGRRRRGWHIDAPAPPTTLEGRTDALLLLVLWSDLESGGGGTRYRPATVELLVRALEEQEEGIDVESKEFVAILDAGEDEVLEVTGKAGDVIIAHAFVFHARSRNYRDTVRILENTMINVESPLDYSHQNPSPSAVERCVLRRLTRERKGRRQWFAEGAERLISEHPDYFLPSHRAYLGRVDADTQRHVAALDLALATTWAQQIASGPTMGGGSVNHRALTCASALRNTLVRAGAIRQLEEADRDASALFAALLSGVQAPASRRPLLGLTLAVAGLEVQVPADDSDPLPVRVRDGVSWLAVDPEKQPMVQPQPTLPAEQNARYRELAPPAARSIAALLAAPSPASAAPDEPEPGFTSYLRTRAAHLLAPSQDLAADYARLADNGAGPLTLALCRWLGRSKEARRAPPEEGQLSRTGPLVIPLSPVPAWVRDIAGTDVRSAVLALAKGRLHVQASTAGDEARRFVVDLSGSSIEEIGPKGKRRPVRNAEAVFGEHRDALRRARARARWIQVLFVGRAFTGYRPTREERAYAKLYEWVTGRAPRPPASGVEEVDRLAGEIATFFDIRDGRFPEVFERADQPETIAPWLRPFVLGVSGDVQRLRESFSDAASEQDASPLSILAGHALALLHFDEQARELMLRGLETIQPHGRADVLLPMAVLSQRLGQTEQALDYARRSILARSDDARFLRRGAARLLELGAVGDAFLVLEDGAKRFPEDAEIAVALGELYAWAGDYDKAAEWAERAGGGERQSRAENLTRIEKLRGIALYGHRRYREAVPFFERASKGPARDECYLFLAELHLRLDHREVALDYLQKSRLKSQTAAHTVLAFLIDENPWGRKLFALWKLFEPEGVLEGATPAGDPQAFCYRMLERLRGNRTDWLTWVEGDGPVRPTELELVRSPPEDSVLSSRDASAETMKRVATHPVEEVIEEMERLAERYPDSPHPHCYRGELMVWLGEYERAFSDFTAGQERQRARWAYVGKAAVHVLRGEAEEAVEQFELCARYHEPVPGATTEVYLGELYRNRGEIEEAKRQLRAAVEAKPRRMGAFMNLALAHETAGELDEARQIFEMVTARVPRLIWDTRRALDEALPWPVPFSAMRPVFEKALEMMRGNRSSHLITYFDRDGALRVAQDAPLWSDQASKWRHLLADELQHRVMRAAPW